MQNGIYLDYHSTTPVLPVVLEAMQPYFCSHFGNSASSHRWGTRAEMAVMKSKKQVSELVGCLPSQVYFTSGATESIHWAVMGWLKQNPKGRIVTTATEHKATYGAGQWAEEMGADFLQVGVDSFGRIQLEELEKTLGDKPTLISFIHGNNEIGTLNSIEKIVAVARKYENVSIHVDAAQSVGKVPIHFANLDVDFLSFSGHKLYAPKGIGAMIVKEKKSLSPLFLGGGQQGGLRAGTMNIPSIVGIGEACSWCAQNMDGEVQRLSQLRDSMIKALCNHPSVSLNGHPEERLPHNLNLTFAGMDIESLQDGLPGVAFSASSACSSATAEPSHVLKAIGLSSEQALSSARFGLGHGTTTEEIEQTTEKILEIMQKA